MRPEKMRMWQAAEALVAEIDGRLRRVKRRSPNAADHLERSAEAVLFNIAEGVGTFRPKMKTLAYEIARKEANEVRAILRRLTMNRVLAPDDIRHAYSLAGAVIGMLTKAIIAVERREEDGRKGGGGL